VKPAAVKYARAGDSKEAIALLHQHGFDAKLLAGGQSLIPLLSFRLARPTILVDLNPATGLDYIREENGHLVIGAMTRQRTLETSPLVREAIPLVPEALRFVGHVTIRNRGTIGGSLAHADAAAELPTAVIALGGELVVEGPGGSRTIGAEDFFVGPFTSAMEHDEILAAVRLPRLAPGTQVAVEELARRHGDFAIVTAMAAIALDASGRVEDVRLALGGAHSVPLRLAESESVLRGIVPSETTIEAAAAAAANAVRPLEDIHAPVEYRRDMSALMIKRAVNKAVNRAKEGLA
jgi:carbon-monoxide dehydrogenase medium subunit